MLLIRNLFKKTTPILGLDINQANIKMLEMNRQGHGYVIERCALEPLASTCDSARGHALQNIIEKASIQGREVAIAVLGPNVFTQVLQLQSGLKEIEIQEQIELGLETWVPFSMDEIFYDFAILPSRSVGSKMQSVRLAVAKRDFIQSQQDWVESFGLKVAVVEVASLALERAFRLFLRPLDLLSSNQQEDTILLEVGARSSVLYVFQAGYFTHFRDMGFNVNQEILAEHLHHVLKIFLSEQQAVLSVRSLMLSGDFAYLSMLKETLQDKFEIEVSLADPLAKLSFSVAVNANLSAQEASRWLLSLGLAAWPFEL